MSVTLYLTNSGSNDVDFFNIYTGSLATGSNLIASNVDRADLAAGYCVNTPSLLYTVESATTYCTTQVYVAVDAFRCGLEVSASNLGPSVTPTPTPTPGPATPTPTPSPTPGPPTPTPTPSPTPVVTPTPTPSPTPVVTYHHFYVSANATGTDPCDNLSVTEQVYWADPDAVTDACGEAENIPPSGTQLYSDCAGTTPFVGSGTDHLIEEPSTYDLYSGPISPAGIIGPVSGC